MPTTPTVNGKPTAPKAGKEIGDSAGMAVNGVVVNSDYNYKLRGTRRIAVYDEMRLGDATVKATLLAVKLPILSANWVIKPASQSRLDKRVAEYVEKQLMDQGSKTWQQTLNDILMYLDYGCMPFEIVWEFNEDGLIGLKKIASRWPDTIVKWKTENGQDGITQQTSNGTFSIPMEKMVIFVNSKEGENWEGISILRSAYKHWYTKDKLYLIDAIASERQGLGVPYAKFQAGSNPQDKAVMEEVLSNLRANEKGYALFPDGWEVGFLDSKGGSVRQIMPSIQHHDRQISKNVLAQFLELGAGTTGSYALSKDQSTLFIQSLEAVANYVKATIQRYLIEKLVDFNFVVDEYPKLEFDTIGVTDVNALTTSIQRAVQTGMITAQSADEDYLRTLLGMPEYTGEAPVDPAMADEIFAQLDVEMADLTGESAPDGVQEEDPENPGFDMSGQPMADIQTAFDKIETWSNTNHLSSIGKYYGNDVMQIIKAGKVGVPLSEETKRKISEALSKGGKKSGGKGKGKKDPAIAGKQAEIKKIQEKVREFKTKVKIELLEMKARGEKLSPEDSAKKQLEILKESETYSKQISKLKADIEDIKSKQPAPAPKPVKKASDRGEIGETLDKINSLVDAYEKPKKS